MRVTLHGLTSTGFIQDLDVLLVGPGGQGAILMSDVCSMGEGMDTATALLTFDDEAASPVPGVGSCPAGTYKPTDRNVGQLDAFFSGAPAGPYPAALSVINGTSPNGAWRLFTTDDDGAGGVQTISGGWSLELAAGSCSDVPATVPAHVGTAADDVITGTAGPDVILGLGGKDELSGLGGEDVVCGGPGKDRLKGGKGKDELRGEGGKDKLAGGGAKDRCIGGKKDDSAKKCEVERSI